MVTTGWETTGEGKKGGKKEQSGMKSYYLIDFSFVKTPI